MRYHLAFQSAVFLAQGAIYLVQPAVGRVGLAVNGALVVLSVCIILGVWLARRVQ